MTQNHSARAAYAAALPVELPALDWVTDPARVARLSQDFAWFSPVLKRQLADKTADVAVRPRTEAEVRAVVAACARDALPITVRGSGTGNYGQAIPLHGGVILDMSACNGFGWLRDGVGRAQAGIRLNDFDREARPLGWELRWLPSTFRSATLGGLFGGGFGGAGSITYGPIAAPGNVLGVRVMTVEAEPRVLELRGAQAMALHHAYGTNGIVLELEVALAPALAWTESIATFRSFDAALEFASALTSAPGIVKKEVCFLGAPLPDLMTPLVEYLPTGCHAVLMLVAQASQEPMEALLQRFGGQISYRKTAGEPGSRTLLEFTWNHTTLVALKADRTLTYIQTGFEPQTHVAQVKALEQALGGEVLMHLEFLRTQDGALTCCGLQIVRYTTEARLNEIMQIHRDHGVMINNPHVYILEDGNQGQLNAAAIETKRWFDPQGLLNPGKMRSWKGEAGEAAKAG